MNYDIQKIGEQIACRRKELNLTQETLASVLGVTPQAISKWECGNGLPDTALLPDIAATLGLSMDELFGLGKPNPHLQYKFPEMYKGLRRVLVYGDMACYSDIPVNSLSDVFVNFTDGSSANLASGELNFRGSGSIELVTADIFYEDYKEEYKSQGFNSLKDLIVSAKGAARSAMHGLLGEETANRLFQITEDEAGKREAEATNLQGIDTLRIDSGGSLDFEVVSSEDGKFRWGALDMLALKNSLDVYQDGNALVFNYRWHSNRCFSLNMGRERSNKLRIELPEGSIKYLEISIAGSSDVVVKQSFLRSKLRIAGSGKLIAEGLGRSNIQIAGSGDVRAKTAGPLQLQIAGSGDVIIEEVGESVDLSVSGSGDVKLSKGSVQNFKLRVSGSADVDASGVCTQDADVVMQGVGDAVIGQILGRSRERISRMADFRVLKRGE